MRGAASRVGHRRAPRRRRVRRCCFPSLDARSDVELGDRAHPRRARAPRSTCRVCRSRSRRRSASRSSRSTATTRTAADPARRRRHVRRQARQRPVHLLRRGLARVRRQPPDARGRAATARSRERELVLHYQPKAALANGDVASVEALIRWEHPERGLVYPDAFIPLAQETSLIGPLTLYVIDEALRQWRELARAGPQARRLGQPVDPQPARHASSRARLQALLSAMATSTPDWLELEVTESSMLANPTRAKAVLDELSELGHPALDRRLRDRLLLARPTCASCPSTRSRSTGRS